MRVIVVDDEKIIRITLSTIIKWEENGFQLIGTASDGIQALEMIENSHIDIVITDLKMPNMDGLELIRMLRDRDYAGKIVVLSNYGDYEYVREAMKLGAIDYMLKVTLTPDELLELLIKASVQLTEDRRLKDDTIHMRIELNEKQLQQRNNLWNELIHEDESYITDVLKEAKKFGFTWDNLNGHLIFIKIDSFEKVLLDGKIKNKKLLNFSVANIIKETISDKYTIDLVEHADGKYAVIVHTQEKHYDVAAWLEIVHNLIQMVNLYLNLSISVALSEPFNGVRQLREQYEFCQRAVTATFYSGAGSVFIAAEKMNNESQIPSNYSDWSDEIKKAIEEYDLPVVSDQLSALIEQLKQRMHDPAVIKQSFLLLLADMDNLIEKWDVGSSKQDRRSYRCSEQVEKQILQAETIEDFKIFAEQALHEAAIQLKQVKGRLCRKEVLRVIEIIQLNVDGKIALETLATEVNMNVNYLSRIFKQDTGKSIVQYINDLKINKAIELLRQPDARIKEIAAIVGIDDPFYFNRLFKKTVGRSPSDFRRKLFPKGEVTHED